MTDTQQLGRSPKEYFGSNYNSSRNLPSFLIFIFHFSPICFMDKYVAFAGIFLFEVVPKLKVLLCDEMLTVLVNRTL